MTAAACVIVALALVGCSAHHARPEVLVVRDPNKLCRMVRFSGCGASRAGPAFVDIDDPDEFLRLHRRVVVEDGVDQRARL